MASKAFGRVWLSDREVRVHKFHKELEALLPYLLAWLMSYINGSRFL